MNLTSTTKSTNARRTKTEPQIVRPRVPTIQRIAVEIESALDAEWIPRLYRERVLSQRTRPYHLQIKAGETRARVSVEHTLLGIELKIGRRRMLCPDLATARYLAVFARAGCASVAVPYNITKISRLADEMETSWERMMLLAIEHGSGDGGVNLPRRASLSRIRLALVASLRREIEAAGDGKQVALDVYTSTKSRSRAYNT